MNSPLALPTSSNCLSVCSFRISQRGHLGHVGFRQIADLTVANEGMLTVSCVVTHVALDNAP